MKAQHKSEKVSVEEAAERIGCNPGKVRKYLREGIWKFGYALSPKQTGKQNWEFNIFREPFENFLKGIM